MLLRQKIPTKFISNVLALFLALVLAHAVLAYDFPLSAESIREAYAIGQRHDGGFLARYKRSIPSLKEKEGGCISDVRVETPFLQVVSFAENAPNYSMQDAAKQFYDKPLPFRIYLDICYMPSAPPPGSIEINIFQNKKAIVPVTDNRSPYIPVVDVGWTLPPNGEQVQLEFLPDKISSSTLTIQIDTPDDQHAEVELDLTRLR
jgi:hypothetical protein